MPKIVRYALLLLHLGCCMVTWYVWYIHPCMVAVKTKSLKRRWSPPTGLVRPRASCFCINDSHVLENSIPSEQLAEILERRGKEFKKHQARTSSSLNTLLLAPSNSPLQYPIQGFTVRPMVPTLIPGLAVHSEPTSSYKGWYAGRTLAVSQVTTKYILWVDDDFLFTDQTKIEDLVEVMEATPELDVVGGSVDGNQFYSSISYEEGDGVTGGCMDRNTDRYFHSLPNYPHCYLVSEVVNFFLARTDSVKRVRFDPKLKRVGHTEFFIDGLGQLMVATCSHVSIGHQMRAFYPKYKKFRSPTHEDEEAKRRLHHYKNYFKCISLE